MNEKVGRHKGAVETLLHEQKELSRLLNIVQQQLQRHITALEEEGIDTDRFLEEFQRREQERNQQALNQQQRQSRQKNSSGNRNSQKRQRQQEEKPRNTENQQKDRRSEKTGEKSKEDSTKRDFNPYS